MSWMGAQLDSTSVTLITIVSAEFLVNLIISPVGVCFIIVSNLYVSLEVKESKQPIYISNPRLPGCGQEKCLAKARR